MNLFLLAAVPLAAVVFHRLFHPTRAPFAEPSSWIAGSIWSLTALLLITPFGEWREYSGDLVAVAAGLAFTDALLAPGLVVGLWVLTRPRRDAWELALWLTLVFTMAGIRDFAASSRIFDLNEYFLVPLQRVLLVLVLPPFVVKAVGSTTKIGPILWGIAAGSLVLTGPVFQVLSFAGWGWMVWVALVGGLAGGLWWPMKKAAPRGSGPDSSLNAS